MTLFVSLSSREGGREGGKEGGNVLLFTSVSLLSSEKKEKEGRREGGREEGRRR